LTIAAVALKHNRLFALSAEDRKSPTRTLRTQGNHVFMAIYATFKLTCLGIANKLNPFALCRKILINASRSAYAPLELLRVAA
jgi:hypothetical protein